MQAQKVLEQVTISYPLAIESRFGEIVVRENDVVTFPEGIYGFESHVSYAVVNLPVESEMDFKVLQCLDEVGLAFLLTPLSQMGQLLIPENHLREATDYRDLKFKSCDFYAITSICEKAGQLEFSVNLKAPIVVERQQKKAWQHILENSDYPVRHVICCNTA